jgi:F1F0 ATPase subunit 2
MTMNDALTLVLVWTAGVLLGALFFGGLWWTVRKSVASKRPALWLFTSLLLRMTMALTGLYFVSDRHWERMLLCLLGFVMARPVVTWLTRTAREHQSVAVHEASRAP